MLPHLESEDPGNMKNRKSLLHRCFGLLLLVIATGVHAGQDDGPYARYTVQGLEVKWLCDGKVVRKDFAQPTNVRLEPECATSRPVTVREVDNVFLFLIGAQLVVRRRTPGGDRRCAGSR